MTGRCSTCSTPTVWITRDGQQILTCPKPACPDLNLNAATAPAATSAKPAAVTPAAGTRANTQRGGSKPPRHHHPPATWSFLSPLSIDPVGKG